MKKIIILLTSIMISSGIVSAEEKKTLSDGMGTSCIEKHKISPGAFGCSVKKMFTKKDGSPNALGKFFNTKTLKDLPKMWKK